MKKLSIMKKLLVGFVAVILLAVILAGSSVFIMLSLNSQYKVLLDYTVEGREYLLQASTDIMNMRRMTSMIHAFAGNAERIDGFNNDFNTSYSATLEILDVYTKLIEADTGLPKEDRANNLSEVTAMRELLSQYKANLFEPNVEYAKVSNLEALNESNVKYGGLITSVNEKITDLLEFAETRQTANESAINDTLRNSLFAFGGMTVVIIVVSILIALWIASLITKPLNFMKNALLHVAKTGNLVFPEEDWALARELGTRKDEIGQSISAFGEVLQQFLYYGECLKSVAANDLSRDIRVLGSEDTCGNALREMIYNFNLSFGEVSVSASQVSSGSAQVAQASTDLATGASEQAATIEEFTAKITEIHSAAAENTQIATETLTNVNEAGRVMNTCINDMGSMLHAMRDIDEKAQKISSVIKAIDDIAFQTNILALNAAVEAARAGQHGKGFAVVADEVRSLASKSADAAKETASLIESSSQSVDDGNKIVAKVNESLQAVSVISAKNAASIEKLYSSSQQQSDSIAGVTSAITQLSSVVQSNSATAEETAAASQVMSGQSESLNQVVNQFKLKKI
jgi:methyl-accepting chemotaxis protein